MSRVLCLSFAWKMFAILNNQIQLNIFVICVTFIVLKYLIEVFKVDIFEHRYYPYNYCEIV